MRHRLPRWSDPHAMVAHPAADQDVVGIGRLLDAGGEVYTIANEVIALHDHVGLMQAKAHAHWFPVMRVAQCQRCAHLRRTADRIHRARKLHSGPRPRRVEDPAVEFTGLLAYQLLHSRHELRGHYLGLLHHGRVAHQVGHHDLCGSAFHRASLPGFFAHGSRTIEIVKNFTTAIVQTRVE